MSNNYSLFLFIFLFFAQLTGLFCEDLLEPSEPLDETEVQEEDIEPPDIEEEKEEETTGEEEDGELTLFQKTLSLDIEGSDYYELYSWCLSLNLDITGDSNVLKQRLYEYYDTPPPLEEPEEGEEKQNIITIRSANSTEYFSIEEVDEEYLLLQGNVIIEIDDQEEGSKHIIKAERIVVNETQHVLTATGNIEYILIRNKGNENEGKDVFIGDNFTFNIDNWSTVFIDATGETNREVEEGEEVDFYYIGENLTRLENDVVILDGGIITSCDDENPHWKLKASKIWVLAPGEFAVKNAVLYLGHVPVFYLPFFFKAGDEMFFHPSIGYRDKEGYFINNTIYILGQKKPSSTGAFSFLKTESETTYYDIELKGLFLRKGEKIEIDESMQKIFKVMLDIYSRLGGFMGVLLHFPGIWDLKGGIGFSRSLREDGNIYTPYDTDSMESHWNKSYFWGLTLPFRFGWESELNIDRTIFDLSYNFDLFSDPYFREDFYIREEDFSWQKVLRKQFGKEFEEEETATDAWELQPEKVSDYTWYLLNSYTFTFNNPYLNKLEIQNIKFNLAWGSKEDTSLTQSTDAWDQINPKREFFYPNRLFSPESLKIKISGTLLQLTSGKKEEEIEEIQEESPGKGIHYPDIPEIQKGEEEIEEFEKESDLPRMIVPDAMVDTPIETETKENNQFTLSYSIEPSLNIEKQFDIENWDSANEVDFKTQYSVLNTGGNFDLVYNMVLFNGYL
jgi:lipopolysaccharide assembly outer membrane protein LptD (OstA)